MRRLVIAAIMMVLLPAAAYAQDNKDKGPLTVKSEKEKKIDAEIDKAYQESLKREGGIKQPVKVDPWQAIRPAGDDSAKR